MLKSAAPSRHCNRMSLACLSLLSWITLSSSEAMADPVLIEQARMSTLTRVFDDATSRRVEDSQVSFFPEFPFSGNTTSASVSDRGNARATVRGAMSADRSGSLTGTASHDITSGTETNSGAEAQFNYTFHVTTPSVLTIDGSVFVSAFNSRASISLDEFLDPGFNTIFQDLTLEPGLVRTVQTQIVLAPDQDYVLRARVLLGSARATPIDGRWSLNFDVQPVPEPGTALLLGLGLGVLARIRPATVSVG